jgi:uncharacterized spore protein YtfJ
MTTEEIDINLGENVTGAVVGAVGRLAEVASADAIVGPTHEHEGRTVIPLASVTATYGLGMGYGSGDGSSDESSEGGGGGTGEGGGGGGKGSARPVAVVEVTDDHLRVHQVVDSTRITLASLGLAAWSVFWITRTVRSFRKS